MQAVLNRYKHPVIACKWEVANRKIRLLQPQAFGYQDKEYLNLRILHLHHAACALTGRTIKTGINSLPNSASSATLRKV
jgi:hypothetical protein